MKIVYLDSLTMGDDIDLTIFEQFGEFVKYETSTNEEALVRTVDADVVLTNKIVINEATVGNAKHLKLVCVTATGTDNLDKDYLDGRGIGWRNVAGYSSNSVAQVTITMLLYLLTNCRYYDDYVKNGDYIKSPVFTNLDHKFFELSGKTWGIIAMGAIGRQVAKIASAFGCKVIYYDVATYKQGAELGYEQVAMETLLTTADVVSIHAPLTDETRNLINKETLAKMKPSAYLINVARGPIINEQDLTDALNNNVIAGAGLDVLTVEPMLPDNPLRNVKDGSKLFIAPHIGWGSVEARTELIRLVAENIKTYFA